MSSQWRLLLAALHFVIGIPASPDDTVGPFPHEATRWVPVIGIGLGLCAAALYWSGSQLWPTSVAVALSMVATALVDARVASFGALYWVLLLLTKYDALMALSAANVPVPLPPYFTLGLIMIAGQAASRALLVSLMATHAPPSAPSVLRVSNNDLSVALIVGLAPAALLGIPGLMGLAAAILMRMLLGSRKFFPTGLRYRERLLLTQQITEVCFYLGALATWKYI